MTEDIETAVPFPVENQTASLVFRTSRRLTRVCMCWPYHQP